MIDTQHAPSRTAQPAVRGDVLRGIEQVPVGIGVQIARRHALVHILVSADEETAALVRRLAARVCDDAVADAATQPDQLHDR